MATLSLKHIYKVYEGTTRAVSDFNMEIRDREFIVFVGPSGCGKSTTLRMIAGLEDISAGELRIDDTIVNDMEPKDRNIAMVFQNYALYPHMTVYENMAFSLRTAKEPKDVIHKKVMEAAEILGITEYLSRKPRALSGGQRQRVALGRAIVRSPKVFLFDEPLSNLDAKLRAAMRAEIIRLYERLGTTFIYVTHDQVEAMTMGSRIVVMRGGFVQQIDTPRNLYNHPANLFVAGFIGTPRMNFWHATLKRAGDRVTVELATHSAPLSFTLPYRLLDRVPTRYMDGEYPLIVGLRPDHVYPRNESHPTMNTATDDFVTLPVTVQVVEALGGETLVYGVLGHTDPDAADNAAGAAEEKDTEDSQTVIFKAGADFEAHRGDQLEVCLRLSQLRVFDRATEESLMPRIPVENLSLCTVADGELRFAGQRFPLPPTVAAMATETGKAQKSAARGENARGENARGEKKAGAASTAPTNGNTQKTDATTGTTTPPELRLPVEALLLGTGGGQAKVLEVTVLDEPGSSPCHLYRLAVGDETLFASLPAEAGTAPRYAAGDTVPFDIDFSRVTVAAAHITPLPTENVLPGHFLKEKVVDTRPHSPTQGKRIYRFYLDMEGHRIVADDELCQKLFSCKGTGIFRTELDYRFTPEAVAVELRTQGDVATAGEGGESVAIPGKVTEILDYGRTTYAKITLSGVPGENHVTAPYGGRVGDGVSLILDQRRITVVDRETGIIIV